MKNKASFSRIISITAALIIFLLLHMIIIESLSADHDCCGEECAICLTVQIVRAALASILMAAVLNTEKIVFCCRKIIYKFKSIFDDWTLVSEKVRLND